MHYLWINLIPLREKKKNNLYMEFSVDTVLWNVLATMKTSTFSLLTSHSSHQMGDVQPALQTQQSTTTLPMAIVLLYYYYYYLRLKCSFRNNQPTFPNSETLCLFNSHGFKNWAMGADFNWRGPWKQKNAKT